MLEAKVAEWNTYYDELGAEVRLKDMGDAAYEETVAFGLMDVCDEDVDLALAVFGHKDNQGGWMSGDVPAKLESMRVNAS